VKVGDHIKKGQTVGVIEAMKMMHNIVSDKEGTITKICVGNGETVEYDQDLLEVSLD
jgi:biotin carboxyl carrier protein